MLRSFSEVDAVCRRSTYPTGQQLLLRAYCFLALGDVEACRLDLREAVLTDSADLEILAAAFAVDPEAAVVQAIIAHPLSDNALLDRAIAFSLQSEPVLLRAKRTQFGLQATVACRVGLRLAVTLDGSAIDLNQATWMRTGYVERFSIRADLSPDASARIEVRQGPHAIAVSVAPAVMTMTRPSSLKGVVSVIVPIYGGRETTRACLSALAEQRCCDALDVVLVDDACPDTDMADEVVTTAAREGWRLLRHGDNLGFAAAVNAGAKVARGHHLLLLNADAILPQGGIDRLLSAAAESEVGTVVPFSNDGSFTSFPLMRFSNPVPASDEASRIDASARRLKPKAVDIPAGTAFCMLVTGPCWDALGGLDLGYGRGYYEDIDLCLRAKRIGFRNVLAPRVYVRHVGSQSFGTAKRALIAENARLIGERFHDYNEAWLPFVEADPLAQLRAEIERQVPPSGPVCLIVGQTAWALPATGVGAGSRSLVLREDVDGSRVLRAEDDGVPQSLRFGPDEAPALASYLAELDIRAVTLVDPTAALLDLLEASTARTVPLEVALIGRRSFRLLEGRPGLLRQARINPLDSMGRAVLGLPFAILSPARPGRPVVPRVAALIPTPHLDIERLVVALDRRLAPRGGEVVIFGETIGRRARPKATGPMSAPDYVAALRHWRITHLLLPDVDAPFKLVEDLRRANALPAAYIDWSQGRYCAASGDLAIDETLAEAERVEALLAWIVPLAPTGAQIA